MILQFEKKGANGVESIHNPTIEQVFNVLDGLNAKQGKTIAILWDEASSTFIQCAGSKEKLMVECKYIANGEYRQYCVGLKPYSVSTISIATSQGEIHVYENEVLQSVEAKRLFEFFHNKKRLAPEFSARDITVEVEQETVFCQVS